MMNIYDKYLPRLAIDYSGIHALLYHLPADQILLSPGGCNQPIVEVDEHRDLTKSRQYITKLDDIQVAMGFEQALNSKRLTTLDLNSGAEFIAILGTAVPNIIGTNMRVISRRVEKITQKPCIFFESNGFELYAKAISKAYLKILPYVIEEEPAGTKKQVNLIGFHPFVHGPDRIIRQILNLAHHEDIEFCLPGFAYDTNARPKLSSKACLSIVISDEGLSLAQELQKTHRIPYEEVLPVSKTGRKKFIQVLDRYTGVGGADEEDFEIAMTSQVDSSKTLLILGEPFLSTCLGEVLAKDFHVEKVQVASLLERKDLARKDGLTAYKNIIFTTDEKDILDLIADSDVILADPLIQETLLAGKDKAFIPLPYFGLSGREYADTDYDYIGNQGFEYLKKELKRTGVLKNEKI